MTQDASPAGCCQTQYPVIPLDDSLRASLAKLRPGVVAAMDRLGITQLCVTSMNATRIRMQLCVPAVDKTADDRRWLQMDDLTLAEAPAFDRQVDTEAAAIVLDWTWQDLSLDLSQPPAPPEETKEAVLPHEQDDSELQREVDELNAVIRHDQAHRGDDTPADATAEDREFTFPVAVGDRVVSSQRADGRHGTVREVVQANAVVQVQWDDVEGKEWVHVNALNKVPAEQAPPRKRTAEF